MLNFLMTATGTWALWKLLDRWVEPVGALNADSGGWRGKLDSRTVAAELLKLGEPGSAVARAYVRIGEAAGAPAVLPRVVDEVYSSLSREQRAAVSLAVLLKCRMA